MPTNPSTTIGIHSRRLMAIKFIQCHWMTIKFSKHATMANEIFSVAIRMWLPKGFWLPQSLGD
jgi:hypothetical protein